ncbi:WhiB family transcriptional regulator [Williamsia serinedens]|uniref:Transcription factor WhiB n=1 Tax=Williamsia serinedens TaxID=391736 RepID=A0ABT1H933_9NOCA|nr:WhiB family transcriptional regulator [Williamsia serinedens]MCP2163128.1 Transcription factor WhiB [Williamsia serinedens]
MKDAWMQQAACIGHDQLFLAEDERPGSRLTRDAMTKCRNTCPVIQECRLYTLKQRPECGVWAGEAFSPTHNVRAAALRRIADKAGVDYTPPQGGTRAVKECGTKAAYDRHRYNNEEPCLRCREAERRRASERRARKAAEQAAS